MKIFIDGNLIASANGVSNTRTSTTYNNFYIGRPNNYDGKYGEVSLDELLFWNTKKNKAFVEDLFRSYIVWENPISLSSQFIESHAAIIPDVVPVKVLSFMTVSAVQVHPCQMKCFKLTWCGVAVFDGHSLCKLYSIFNTDGLLGSANSSLTTYLKL